MLTENQVAPSAEGSGSPIALLRGVVPGDIELAAHRIACDTLPGRGRGVRRGAGLPRPESASASPYAANPTTGRGTDAAHPPIQQDEPWLVGHRFARAVADRRWYGASPRRPGRGSAAPGSPRQAGLRPSLDGRNLAGRRERRAGIGAERRQLLRQRYQLWLGAGSIGDRTDIPNWLEWFDGPNSGEILAALVRRERAALRTTRDRWPIPAARTRLCSSSRASPIRTWSGSPTDPASPGEEYYRRARQVRLQPDPAVLRHPSRQALHRHHRAARARTRTYAENARAFNTWLVEDWLRENEYPYNNVAVFDFYNVLTGPDNHHRYLDGAVEHVWVEGRNTSYYPSSSG